MHHDKPNINYLQYHIYGREQHHKWDVRENHLPAYFTSYPGWLRQPDYIMLAYDLSPRADLSCL